MTAITTGNVLSAGTLDSYFSDLVNRQFKADTFFYDIMPKKMLPKGSHTYTETVFDKIAIDLDDVLAITEAAEPLEVNGTSANVEISTIELSAKSTISRKAESETFFNIFEESSYGLAIIAGELIDEYLQRQVDSAFIATSANRIRPTGFATRADLDGTALMSKKLLVRARTKLKKAKSPTIGGSYVAVMPTDVVADLMEESATGSFTDINKYTQGSVEKLFNGEIGKMYGVRIVESNHITVLEDAGKDSADVYTTYVFGQDAYHIVEGDGLEVFVKKSGPTDTSNAANKRGTVAFYTRIGAKVIRPESVVIIETTASAV